MNQLKQTANLTIGISYNMARQKKTPRYLEDDNESFVEFKDVVLTARQKQLEKLIYDNKIVIATGPPGTSKTFCAVYAGLKLYSKGNDYNKIIIIKPTEIVGSTALGFTPGSLDEKIGVYMENFADVFEDIIEMNSYNQMITAKDIQFKAAQFVRGRTWKKSIVIVDEFQSLDVHQLKSIATRIGKDSKIIFCGDIKQSDIPKKYVAVNVLKKVMSGLPNTAIFEFTTKDVQFRDPLVTLIEDRFDMLEAAGELTPTKKNG